MTGNETARKMGVFRRFVKSPSNQLLLTNSREKLIQTGDAGNSAGTIRPRNSVHSRGQTRRNSTGDIRHRSVRCTQQASAHVISRPVPRMCSRLWSFRATSRQRAKVIPEFLRLPSLGC